ncbi:MAG: M23 family metallopeptidase [Sarcina sp.]
MMLGKERYVYLNNKKIGNNGFKNLSFETSRFSDSYSSIRGFGSHLNEKNLNIIDAFSIEFYLDYKELADVAETYMLFKALGVLKLENEYILEKISSSLSHNRAVQEVLIDYKDAISAKETTSLLVLLERMDITSLERTNNGYVVNMVLTLLKDGLTKDQEFSYNDKYNEWRKTTNFDNIIGEPISKYISDLSVGGGMSLEIFNIEALNANFKNKALINYKDTFLRNEDEAKKDIEERLDNLNKYEDYSPDVIEIPSVNIAQIQLITNNTISNTPIYGEPIGNKSFMGIDKTGFTVKMIFDETDNVLLEKIKKLSDLNITKHKIRVNTALVNLFDFKTGVITNVFFNNSESANGILVTMKIELSAYDYFSDNANTDTIVDFSGKTVSNNNINATNMYLESIANNLMDKIGNKSSTISDIRTMFQVPLYTFVQNTYDDFVGGVSQESTGGNVFKFSYTFGDFLSSYSSDITSFGEHGKSNLGSNGTIGTITDDGKYDKLNAIDQEKYINLINDEKFYMHFDYMANGLFNGFNDGDIKSSNFASKDLFKSYLYRYCDIVSTSVIHQKEKIRNEIQDFYSGKKSTKYDVANSYSVTNKDSVFTKNVVENTLSEFFNDKIDSIDKRLLFFLKSIYRTYFFDLYRYLNKSTNVEIIKNESSYIGTKGIDYKLIRGHIKNLLIDKINRTTTMIDSDNFIGDSTTMVLSELIDGLNERTSGHTYSNVNLYLTNVAKDIKSDFKVKSSNIEEITDLTMGFFMTKLCYSLSFISLKENKNIIDKIIKSHIVSSAILGFLSIRVKNRTDSLGFAYNDSCKAIGKNLTSFFYLSQKMIPKTEDVGNVSRTNIEVINDSLGLSTNKSNYIDKVTFDFFNIERNIIEEQNKDYNFIYGKKFDNAGVVMFLDKVFSDSSDLTAFNQSVESYLVSKHDQFNSGEKFCDKLDEIIYNFPEGQFFYPATKNNEFFHDGDKINTVMKKRILGVGNPFGDLKKINQVINNPVYNVMPDYEVLIKKADFEFEGKVGTRNDIAITGTFLLKNVISMKVGYDPKTKIKTANIISVDVGKRLVDLNKDGAISVQVSKNDSVFGKEDDETNNTIEMFTIEPGDLIEIRTGSFDQKNWNAADGETNDLYKKTLIFKGTIASSMNSGGFIDIKCSGLASSFYSNTHKEVKLHEKSIFTKTLNLFTSIFKYGTTTAEIVDAKSFNSYASTKTCNNHLFNSFGVNYNETFKAGELCSFYNLAYFALGCIPSSIKELFSEGSSGSGALAVRKSLITQLDQAFGSNTVADDPRSVLSDPGFFRNIYNIDKDFDTYGLTSYSKDGDFYVDSTLRGEVNQTYEQHTDSYEKPKEEEKDSTKEISAQGFIWPCKSRSISSPFSYSRVNPVDGVTRAHRAIDIRWNRGANNKFESKNNYIYASRDGVCKLVDSTGGGLGVRITHEYEKDGKKYPCSTYYCHMASRDVHNGKKVKQGDIIGIMGTTGRSTGIHLHFEIEINGEKVNPEKYLS